jgi:alpha-L-fucosidase 2
MTSPVFPLDGKLVNNVEYGRAGSASLHMDVRLPAGNGPFPAAILVHGGGWIRGDRAWNMAPLFEPLTGAGIASFAISYRLASDFFQIGAAVDDVRHAVKFIREHAREYNVDPNRIALIGESAGAHLASLAALAEPKSVAAVVSLYSPNDLEHLARTSTAVPDQVRRAVESSGMAELILDHLRSLSPVQHVKPNAPPFLLIHGTSDSIVPYDQSERMQSRLRSAGVDVQLIPVKGGAHGLRYWGRTGGQAEYLTQMLAWLHKKLS